MSWVQGSITLIGALAAASQNSEMPVTIECVCKPGHHSGLDYIQSQTIPYFVGMCHHNTLT